MTADEGEFQKRQLDTFQLDFPRILQKWKIKIRNVLMWFPKVDFSKTTKIEIRNIWKWLPNFPRWMLTIADAQLEDSGELGSE